MPGQNCHDDPRALMLRLTSYRGPGCAREPLQLRGRRADLAPRHIFLADAAVTACGGIVLHAS
jgi:hypothetical protein